VKFSVTHSLTDCCAGVLPSYIYVNASSSNGTFCTSNVGNCPKCI